MLIVSLFDSDELNATVAETLAELPSWIMDDRKIPRTRRTSTPSFIDELEWLFYWGEPSLGKPVPQDQTSDGGDEKRKRRDGFTVSY